jgi:hypothetical protein
MSKKDKCCWCKCTATEVTLHACRYCKKAKFTCTPCYGGALGVTIPGKNDTWACNECMKDRMGACYQKNAPNNWYHYNREKQRAGGALGTTISGKTRSLAKANPQTNKVAPIRKEHGKENQTPDDEENTDDDESSATSSSSSSSSSSRYCR